MAIVFLGADFHDAPLSVLEAFEKKVDLVRERLASAPDFIEGSVVVSTCNRAEIYIQSDTFQEALDYLIVVVAETLAERPEVIGKIFRVHYGSSATRHLFSVTAGLESMVVGEGEISGQMRMAVSTSRESGQLSRELSAVFQKAFAVAKSVWRSSDVGNSGRSIIFTALTLASATLGDLAGKKALVVGTGAYARVITAALKRSEMVNIGVYSRSNRAESFAKSHGIRPVSAQSLVSEIASSDLIVSASGSHGYAIEASTVNEAMAGEGHPRPRVFIDVALSRDIDPEIARMNSCAVITLDLLRLHNPPEHAEAIARAEAIIDKETAAFLDTLHERAADPAISALRAHIDARVSDEVEAVRRRRGDDVADEVQRALRRVTNALVHTPVTRGKELARDGRPDDYREALELLFGLDVSRDG